MDAAIYYLRDGYDTSQVKLMGRQAAGEAFLKSYVKYADTDNFYCYTTDKKALAEFQQRIKPFQKKQQLHFIPFGQEQLLKQAGTMFYPGPGISDCAWQRRYGNAKDYSICGVTHTTASKAVMDQLGELLTGPNEPWDALIFTSHSVKSMAMNLLDARSEYLKKRFGKFTAPKTHIQMPIIPLGVDCDEYSNEQQAAEFRKAFRTKLNISDKDIVVLFMGRLSYHAKAHPLPMYQALQEVAKSAQQKIHLIQAGWFANDAIKGEFVKGAQDICPSVQHHFVDGRNQTVRQGIWYAADFFTSMSDNIQETFGLTPVEAMAAGLPVVISDWDGYRSTVNHGEQGFLIPSYAPEAGAGEIIAKLFSGEAINYDHYIGIASQSIAIDVTSLIDAYQQLITNNELRQKMSAAAKQRAKQVYDWQVVIKQYQELWKELADIRQHKKSILPVKGYKNPMRMDPYELFSKYPTKQINLNTKLIVNELLSADSLAEFCKRPMTSFVKQFVASEDELTQLYNECKDEATVKSLQKLHPEMPKDVLLRSVAWLIKMGLVRVL